MTKAFPSPSGLAILLACVSTLHAVSGIEWQTSQPGTHRWAPLPANTSGTPGFRLQPPSDSGITFQNTLSESLSLTNQIPLNGSGVAAGDVDGDGWTDLYFCGLQSDNRLYRNQGDWTFTDITSGSNAGLPGVLASGAAMADIDGDYDLDLIVNTIGEGSRLLMNDGRGVFQDRTASSGLPKHRGAMSLALADINGDGLLDLYITNYRVTTFRDMPNTRFRLRMFQGTPQVISVNGRPTTDWDLVGRYSADATGQIFEHGQEDDLLLNRGNGRFERIPFTQGFFRDVNGAALQEPPYEWGLSAMFRDINGDQQPDLYICNDFDEPDRFWIHRGDHYQAIDSTALRHVSWFSMGVDFADIDRDGDDDFVVVDMLSQDHTRRQTQFANVIPPPEAIGAINNRPQYVRNTLQLNRGDTTFAEIANLAGIPATEWSWSVAFMDVDLDGFEDLLITNGFERDAQNVDVAQELERLKKERPMSILEQLNLRKRFPALRTKNLAYRNRGDLTFEDMTDTWRFGIAGVSQGMALADLDNDGDLDVAINNLNAVATILRNECPSPRIAVRLKGQAPNTFGIGARISVHNASGASQQSQEMMAGGRYLSSDDPVRMFASPPLVAGADPMRLAVVWRSGQRTTIEDVHPNRIYEILEADAKPTQNPTRSNNAASRRSWFAEMDIDADPHQEQPFDEFQRQPLLPRRLSQLGPGVAWFDMDQDGWEDLIVGSGRAGRIGVLANREGQTFAPLRASSWNRPVARDTTTVLGWTDESGTPHLLTGSANFEDGLAAGPGVLAYSAESRRPLPVAPGAESSTGPMALADIDNDGDLDLFVGGRAIAGRYPAKTENRILLRENGTWQPDPRQASALGRIRMASGAVFADLNHDGWPDLVVAEDWGPVRIFINDGGVLADHSDRLGTANLVGWWNGVATGDFDADGRMDILATNWGRNTRFEPFMPKPIRLITGPPEHQGTSALISWHSPALNAWAPEPRLDLLAVAMPAMRARFDRYEAYGRAGISDLFPEPAGRGTVLEVAWLDTTCFYQRENGFQAQPLPTEAQLSPAFAACVADFDGDGHLDVFLSQNCFAVRPDTERLDAGRGLMLRGVPTEGFRPIDAQTSGIAIYGEQRGAAAADFDHDGRIDLAVSQNGAATRLFRNTQALPGLRAMLKGPPGNPHAVGTQLQMVYSDGSLGPTHEIQAGSGYWSQGAFTQVLGRAKPAQALRLRWPGGRSQEVPISSGAKELEITFPPTSRVP